MEKKIKLLHVIDDQKFIPYCERTFSLTALENIFCSSKDFETTISTEQFEVIVIHYLREECIQVLNNRKINAPVVWFFWGADGFCLGKFYNRFLLPATKRSRLLLAFKTSFKNGLKVLGKTYFPQSIDRKPFYKSLIQSFSKISVVVPIVPGDFDLLSENYPLRACSFHLNYVSPVFDSHHSPIVSGNNILVGNSAHFSNNHIEIINILSKIGLGSRKVIIPLSYGDRVNSRFIANYAMKKLPLNAVCLTDFLSFEEYQKIMQSCSIVIMNHLRQQALGNVIQALATGAQLFLQPSSTLYKYLKDKGFIIPTIEELKDIKPLLSEEREYNKRKCNEFFGKELQHIKVKQLIELALSQKPTGDAKEKNNLSLNY